MLGSAAVFFLPNGLGAKTEKVVLGFASGVMIAASVWSLLLPAIESSSYYTAAIGFLLGIAFLLLLDFIVPHLHPNSDTPEGPKSKVSKSILLILSVTLHNIPEGMAVGATYAGWMTGSASISMSGALALAIGIAIQNFPEGAIVSMPLVSCGTSRNRSFLYGMLSGIVEPASAVLTILLASAIVPFMPYLLSFAAGAMLYVVVEELIPEMAAEKHSNVGTIMFAIGFSLMMVLDVALG